MTRRGIRAWGALLALFAALAIVLVKPGLVAHAEPGDEGGPSVTITSITPSILTNQDSVTIRVHVANLPATDQARIAVFMSANSIPSYDWVQDFLENGGYVWDVSKQPLTEDQQQLASTAAGTDLDLSFDVKDSPLWNPQDWGPYGIEVRVLGAVANQQSGLAYARTLLPWYGEEAEGSANLNLLASQAADETGPEWPGLARPGVTVGLTPPQALAAADRPAEPGNGTDEGTGAQSGPAAVPVRPEVLVLPLEAADMSLLAATDQSLLYDFAQQSRVDQRLDSTAGRLDLVQDAVLATQDWFSLAVLALADSSVVLAPPQGLSSSAGPAAYKLRVALPADGDDSAGSATVLDSWGELSALITEPLGDTENAFLRQQQIRALTALGARQGEDQYLWANLGHELDPTEARERIAAALDAPWITPSSLRQTLDAPSIESASTTVQQLPAGDVAGARSALDPVTKAAQLALAVIDSSGAEQESSTGNAEMSGLLRESLAPAGMGLSVKQAAERARASVANLMDLYDVIDVAPTRTVNVLSSAADFPVTLANKGNRAMDVLVGLDVADQRLRADQWVEVTVPAGSTATANVPIHAVGSGNVGVVITAKAPDGLILDQSDEVLVRVHPGLGDAVTWVVGSALAALFVLGLFRTLRRGRRGVGKASG